MYQNRLHITMVPPMPLCTWPLYLHACVCVKTPCLSLPPSICVHIYVHTCVCANLGLHIVGGIHLSSLSLAKYIHTGATQFLLHNEVLQNARGSRSMLDRQSPVSSVLCLYESTASLGSISAQDWLQDSNNIQP